MRKKLKNKKEESLKWLVPHLRLTANRKNNPITNFVKQTNFIAKTNQSIRVRLLYTQPVDLRGSRRWKLLKFTKPRSLQNRWCLARKCIILPAIYTKSLTAVLKEAVQVTLHHRRVDRGMLRAVYLPTFPLVLCKRSWRPIFVRQV